MRWRRIELKDWAECHARYPWQHCEQGPPLAPSHWRIIQWDCCVLTCESGRREGRGTKTRATTLEVAKHEVLCNEGEGLHPPFLWNFFFPIFGVNHFSSGIVQSPQRYSCVEGLEQYCTLNKIFWLSFWIFWIFPSPSLIIYFFSSLVCLTIIYWYWKTKLYIIT